MTYPTVAFMDRPLCLASGLFISLPRRTRRDQFGVISSYGEIGFCFQGPEHLGADDLKVLQAVVALAKVDSFEVSESPATEAGRRLRQSLAITDNWLCRNLIGISCSYGKLARTAGYTSSGATLQSKIHESLVRLSEVVISENHKNTRASSRLLTFDKGGIKPAILRIVLNPRSSECRFGAAQFARIDMEVARQLSSPARILDNHLSAFIDVGKKMKYAINRDTLLAYVWPDSRDNLTHKEIVRQRRRILKNLIEEIEKAGWSFSSSESPSEFYVSRPQEWDGPRPEI